MDSLLKQQASDGAAEAVPVAGNGDARAVTGADVASRDSLVAESLRRVARAEADRDRLQERALQLGKQLARVESDRALERAEAEAELAAALDENDRLRQELQRHVGWLQSIESSFSWRLTSGLRRAKAAAVRRGR